MYSLSLFRGSDRLAYLRLEKKIYKLGRASHCEIQLPDPHLSREHALLIWKDDSWWIEDQSKNGIFDENRNPLTGRQKIPSGKLIELSRHYQIQIDAELTKEKEKTLLLSRQPTQLHRFDPENGKVIIGRGKIIFHDTQGTEHRLEIPSYGLTIGSHPSNEVSLQFPAVSRFHARIETLEKSFYVQDLQSTNGTSVNGIRISRAELPDRAEIQVGDQKVEFQIEREETEITPKSSDRLLQLVSKNIEMKKLFSMLEVLGPTDATVHISGETGTGKELVARALHQLSRREQGPFIALNCAALPKDLVESELFGHEKGSFTGAIQNQMGAFEAAHQGTLFLDEIAELDLASQAKLLRVLETKEIKRVGSQRTLRVSVRVLAASHKDLRQEVALGRFRQDLFFRLHVAPVYLPPLRNRLEDLQILSDELLKSMNLDFQLGEDALLILKEYSFPGNIRELKNLLQRAAIEFALQKSSSSNTSEKILTASHFSFMTIQIPKSDLSDDEAREKAELFKIMQDHQFNQSKAAKNLGLPLSTFNDKIRKYGIQKPKTLLHQ